VVARVIDVWPGTEAWLRAVPPVDPWDRIRRGALVHATTPRPPIGVTPHEVVHTHDKLTVRYYAPPAGSARRAPFVVVPSMINKAAVLDLEADRSLVGAMARFGHPTYLIDWGVPAAEDAGEDVAYVLHDLLHRSIDRVCRHARAPKAHVLGYCMGGTLAAMLAALRPERFLSLAALAAPIRFHAGGRFYDFSAEGVLDVDATLDPSGLLPVEAMAPVFKMLDPVGNITKFLAVERAAHDPRALARVLARERWLEENVPLQGAFAREFIRYGYQQDRLLAGTWPVGGERVRLERITCPTLVLVCQGDRITPADAARPLAGAVGGPAKTVELPTGHIGAVVGSFGPKTFYPLLDRWVREGHA
jgi:polyhydroxyalkanoate synthase